MGGMAEATAAGASHQVSSSRSAKWRREYADTRFDFSFVLRIQSKGPRPLGWYPLIFRKGLPTQLTVSQTHLVDSTSSQVDNEKEPLNVGPLSI